MQLKIGRRSLRQRVVWSWVPVHNEATTIGKAIAMPSLATLPIAVLADKTGVSIDMIRSYERLGLVSKSRHIAGGLSLYSSDEVERITFIRRSLELGFSMEAVRDMLGIGRRKSMTCGEIYAIAERQLADIRRRQADLARMEQALIPLIEGCPQQGGLASCPIIHALSQPEITAQYTNDGRHR